MTEEERRRCCILGGCGCGPEQQQAALAEELAIAGSDQKGAAAVLGIFGTGPHRDRLKELGLAKESAVYDALDSVAPPGAV